MREAGYRAVKFGWGPFGKGSVETDAKHLMAARSGIGTDGTLLIDAGTIWVDDVNAAAARLPTLKEVKATWLEEPFVSGALAEYQRLAGFAGCRSPQGENPNSDGQLSTSGARAISVRPSCSRRGNRSPARFVGQ